MAQNTELLLDVQNLSVSFQYKKKAYNVVRNVDFQIRKNEILGIVGESGSGKSVMSKAILRLIPEPPGHIQTGSILFHNTDLLKLKKSEMYSIRGNHISMIFQEPMTSLNPVYTCGDQISEAIILHQHLNKHEAKQKALEMLARVKIPFPEKRYYSYPYEMSGGMRQRVMIAIALSCSPELLIADEPTTALDPTIQAQILALMKQLQKENEMSIMLITHDLGVVAECCSRVIVMYCGMVMEEAGSHDIFHKPLHPYTQGLLKAIPQIRENVDRLYTIKDSIPHFTEFPSGCPFRTRCPFSCPACEEENIKMNFLDNGHATRCVRYKELLTGELRI